jgi:hypothetical protein
MGGVIILATILKKWKITLEENMQNVKLQSMVTLRPKHGNIQMFQSLRHEVTCSPISLWVNLSFLLIGDSSRCFIIQKLFLPCTFSGTFCKRKKEHVPTLLHLSQIPKKMFFDMLRDEAHS